MPRKLALLFPQKMQGQSNLALAVAKFVPIMCPFVPTRNFGISAKSLIVNGGDDGTRTRGLCRDRAAF